MDRETAIRPCSQKWQATRVLAILFLIVACGLLTSSLLAESPMSVSQKSAPTWGMR